MDAATASWKKFFVQLEGKTNGAHQTFVTKLKDASHIKVDSPEESDYILLFCPIVSRVGTDISEALENITDDKPTVLVVMHHTFDPHHVVAESKRLVEKQNVYLTVDCLFYEGKLLSSNRNDIAWFEIQKFFGLPFSQINTLRAFKNFFKNDNRNKTKVAWCAVCCLLVIIGIIVAVICFNIFRKK